MTIEKLILEGYDLINMEDPTELPKKYEQWRKEVTISVQNLFTDKDRNVLKVKMFYTENEYSAINTSASIKKAIQNTCLFLEEKSAFPEENKRFSPEIALVERILNHFPMYYLAMYRRPVHKKGTLRQDLLESVSIGNEYDLQRMLYSLLLPLFPTARTEVNSDNGYGGMRADIYLTDPDLIIEIKCTRETMTEKQLMEELGADGFHYHADVLFFFIYDKNSLIKNPEAFKRTFERDPETYGKMVRAFVLQPVNI